jgi:hypothetical protein
MSFVTFVTMLACLLHSSKLTGKTPSLLEKGWNPRLPHCQSDCIGWLHPPLRRTVWTNVTLVQVSNVTVSQCYIAHGRYYIDRVQCDMGAWRCCIAGYPTDATLVRFCLDEVKPNTNAPRLKISPTQYCIDHHRWNGWLKIALRQFWIGSCEISLA